MKVAIISKADASGGGASRVADDLAKGLPRHGVETEHFTAWKTSERRAYGPGPIGMATGVAHAISRKTGFGDIVPWELPALLAMLAMSDHDLVHVHDTSASFSPLTLAAVSKIRPLLWTMHDCSPFTGGCIYPQMHGCTRYLADQGCGPCPAHGEWPLDGKLETSRVGWHLRAPLLSSGKIGCVAPSSWMADTAMASGRLSKRPRVISNAIDTDVFAPSDDRKALRRRLGLPEDRIVLMTSAGNVSDVRKGLGTAIEVAGALSSDPILVLVGKPHSSAGLGQGKPDRVYTGYVSDRLELAEWYAASDAFLYCSVADNQPLSVIESLSSGVPVFGWAVGGVPEMVTDRENGMLVPFGDLGGLVTALDGSIADPSIISAMGNAARVRALADFSMSRFLDEHIDTYRSMLTSEKSKAEPE